MKNGAEILGFITPVIWGFSLLWYLIVCWKTGMYYTIWKRRKMLSCRECPTAVQTPRGTLCYTEGVEEAKGLRYISSFISVVLDHLYDPPLFIVLFFRAHWQLQQDRACSKVDFEDSIVSFSQLFGIATLIFLESVPFDNGELVMTGERAVLMLSRCPLV